MIGEKTRWNNQLAEPIPELVLGAAEARTVGICSDAVRASRERGIASPELPDHLLDIGSGVPGMQLACPHDDSPDALAHRKG